MWIDATGGEDELEPAGAIEARGEECVASTGVAGTGLEAGVADIKMWGS